MIERREDNWYEFWNAAVPGWQTNDFKTQAMLHILARGIWERNELNWAIMDD